MSPRKPQKTTIATGQDAKWFASQFDRLANELERARDRAVKPRHVEVHANRAVIQAARLVIEAVNAGHFDKYPKIRTNLRYIWSGTISCDKGTVTVDKAGGWHIEACASVPEDDGAPLPVGTADDGQLLRLWGFPIFAVLRSLRPASFKARAGAFDWVIYRTDGKGRFVGKDGKPLRYVTTEQVDTSTGRKTIRGKLAGDPIATTDGYDDEDWLAHLQARVGDWADACRVLADLVVVGTGRPTGATTRKRAKQTELTPREEQVKLRIDIGQSQVAIARDLNITEGRVSQIVGEIKKKKKAKRSRSVALDKAVPLHDDYSADDTTSKRTKRQRK